MQETRRQILEILKTRYEATVDEVVDDLRARRSDNITAVTVRHHLKVLQEEGLVNAGRMRHRDTPGRPQHVYGLTERGAAYFPGNYQRLAGHLLQQIEKTMPAESVNVIIEGVATGMAADAGIPQGSLEKRLEAVVQYLNQTGYKASVESVENGFMLHTHNCPYHHLARETDALCGLDMRLISSMIGIVPRRISHMVAGDSSCSYFIPTKPVL
ncbi:MAG: ArsR family transcriptional regulator [Anaerolineae bacterium]|jgi:predicted ArsR family transcriptional regulator|nr:ArsR family transcriptional regulator [Anaerolineae bacterium]